MASDPGTTAQVVVTSLGGGSWSAAATIAAAMITVIGSLFVAFITLAGVKVANALKDREQKSRDADLVRDTLEFLTGGSQKRTVGIVSLRMRVSEGLISKEDATEILKGHQIHLTDDINTESARKIEEYNLTLINKCLETWAETSQSQPPPVLPLSFWHRPVTTRPTASRNSLARESATPTTGNPTPTP